MREATDKNAADLLSEIDAGVAPLVVDVRTPREFAAGHVPGAINVPLQTLLLSRLKVPASRDDAVVVYCGHGPRARIAAASLWYAGYQRVMFLRGHMAGWRKAGLREET